MQRSNKIMKLIIVLFWLSSNGFCAELSDESFKNNEKYTFLKTLTIGELDSINLDFKFIPPKGKKVNHASSVKVWEKNAKDWALTDSLELNSNDEEFGDNILTHNSILKSKKSEVAIEIDFIHCDFKGGRCDQEKFLSKLIRKSKSTESKVKYVLKIKG
jgi:hypothetical protein